jgi:hypothetical protein
MASDLQLYGWRTFVWVAVVAVATDTSTELVCMVRAVGIHPIGVGGR